MSNGTGRVHSTPTYSFRPLRIEKASRPVQMLLLQILEEGKLQDSHGREVNFKNTIIVLTSNLGSEVLYEPGAVDADGKVTPAARARVMQVIQASMAPELLNRLDEQLIFNRLSKESLRRIVDIRLKEVEARLAGRRITLDVDDDAKAWLAKQGYQPAYGARPLNRVIQRHLLSREYPINAHILRSSAVGLTKFISHSSLQGTHPLHCTRGRPRSDSRRG